MDSSIHEPKSIKLEKIKSISDFYTRELVITTAKGEEITITFFGRDKRGLHFKKG